MTIDLSNFYGTEQYHKTFLFNPKLVHTDGVKYFADEAGAYWFLDIIATDIFTLTKDQPFLSIELQVKNGSATIFIGDGNETLETRSIDYTDCPDGEYHFYLTGNVLMLPSEY
jgi:hypothetical protein